MSVVPKQKEIVELMKEASGFLKETPPSLIEFRTLAERVRELTCTQANEELYFMNFILDGLLDQIMRHVAGHASTIVNKDDATSLVRGIGEDLSHIAESLEERDLNTLHSSYVTLVANYFKKVEKIGVEER